MNNENTALSLKQCAAKFNRSEKDIEQALNTLGVVKRVTKGTRLNADNLLKLSDYFSKQSKQKAGSAPTRSGGTRKIQSIEVTERKIRTIEKKTSGRLSLAELRQRKTGVEAEVEKPAEVAAPAPAAVTPAEQKTVQIKKPALVTEQPAEQPAEQPVEQPVEQSAEPAEKTPEKAAKKPAKKAAAKPKPAAKKAVKEAAAKEAAAETAETATEEKAAKPARKRPAKAPAEKKTTKKKAAAEADEAATPPPAAETNGAAAAAMPGKQAAASGGAYDIEKLLTQQIAHKEEQEQKQKDRKEAVEKSKKDKDEAAKQKKLAKDEPVKKSGETEAAKKSPDGEIKKHPKKTIGLDKKALAEHKKRRKKNISRTEAREKTADNQHTFIKPAAPVVREIKIPDAISVDKLANETALKKSVIIRKLMDHGMTVTANELLDKETAWILVEELGHTPLDAPDDNMEKELLKSDVVGSDIRPRAPVVTVMGHVDHGKTSLLDYIRKTRVASGEAGGITQHIGAYRVDTAIGAVTFLDTPGHALFSQIRARGAKITDLVVLVVAADDGVKPQTIEAINHAKAANVNIIVAANKMDKPNADLDKVKRELSEQNVLPEDWGGDTMVIPVSAASGKGVDNLLDALAMQTELLELTAPLDVPAAGTVIEARVDKGRGIVATIVTTRGVLKRGDAFLCGAQSGRVRTMWNLSNPKLDSAEPSVPVEIQGLSGIPEAGAELLVVEDERIAREVAEMRQDTSRINKMVSRHRTGSDKTALLLDAAAEKEWKELNVVIKADVEGSREAMAAALSDISGKNAGVKVIHSAVGTVTESDIYLAQTGGGVVVAFNVRPDSRARKLAESRGVKIIVGNVVYDLVEKVRDSVLGLLAPIIEEAVVGTAAVQEVFNISSVGNIAGCLVQEGTVRAKAPLRLLRDHVTVYEGVISSLYHFKDQVSEVRAGSECGIGIARYNDIKAGDVIEILERTETAPEM